MQIRFSQLVPGLFATIVATLALSFQSNKWGVRSCCLVFDVCLSPLLNVLFGNAANVIDDAIFIAFAQTTKFFKRANEIVEVIYNIINDCIVLFAMIAFNAISTKDLLTFDEFNDFLCCPIAAFVCVHASLYMHAHIHATD